MKDKIIVAADIVVESPSMQQSSQEDPSTFMSSRFYALSKTHNTAIISGSSLAKQHQHIAQELVLDAAATAYITNEQAIVIGIKQATADGLGGSADDSLENQSIAKIADYACQTFINNDAPTTDLLHNIASQSMAQALFEYPNKKYESTCAMASANFIYKDNGSYEGELANIGDTLLVVLSPDLKVKKMLPARQIYRGYNRWSPESIQSLTTDPGARDHLICEPYSANEGDLILSMTDGIWSELAQSSAKVGDGVRDTMLDIHSFESLLQEAGLGQNFPVLDAALTLLSKATNQTLAQRNTLFQLVTELQLIVFPTNIKTVDEVLLFLKNNNKIEIANALEKLLFEGSGGDGVVYFKGISIPFSFVMKDLCERTYGDCSTISITRLPWHLDELIRVFILNPTPPASLLRELKNNLSSVNVIEQSILRLKQEQVPTQPRVLLSNLESEKLFHDEELDRVKVLLIHLFQLQQLISSSKNYQARLALVEHYLDNEVPESMRRELYSLAKKELSPKTGIFSFFKFHDRTLYHELSEKYEPNLKFRNPTLGL